MPGFGFRWRVGSPVPDAECQDSDFGGESNLLYWLDAWGEEARILGIGHQHHRPLSVRLVTVYWYNHKQIITQHKAVLRIRIRRIRMFLSLLALDPDPLVRSTDPDPSIMKQK